MKNKRIVIAVITLLVLFTTSITMYCSYDRINSAAKKETSENIDISSEVYRRIFESNYVIANKLDIEEGIQTSLKDKYMEIHESTAYNRANNEGFIESDIQNFNSKLRNWEYDLNESKNFKYYAKNLKTGKSTTNDKNLIPENIAQNQSEVLSNYRWYLKVTYNQNGEVQYENLSKDNSFYSEFIQYVSNEVDSSYYNDSFQSNNTLYDDVGQPVESEDVITYKNLRDMEYVYAIPKNISSNDDIYYWYTSDSVNKISGIYIPYILIGIALVMLYTFCVPITYLKEMPVFRNLIKIKLGFWILIYSFLSGLVIGLGADLIYAMQQGIFLDSMKQIGLNDVAFLIGGILNVGIWVIFFGMMMFMSYQLKYLFHIGFKRFIKENTVCGWFYYKFIRLINRVLNFDLKERTNQTVIKIVVVNFFIVTIISFFFAFGFFFAFIYSLTLFFILKDKLNHVKKDYNSLLKSTKKLSDGDFNVEINQDLGMFSSLSNEFVNIKGGFKKAVDEEVKSQKMKTELISNVSHDLKTPLTSIITYVDLLKEKDISDEEKTQYIDTIDRNSQRLKNLIDDLFEMSKANSGDVNLNIVNVNIVSLIQQAHFECSDKFVEANLDCKINFSNDKIICPLDSSKTYRIFENLLMNICKYAMSNTRVYIDVIEQDNEVSISFKNISANEIDFGADEIIERFARGDKSRNSDGSGLGLAIAKSFTELQKGIFKVEVDGDLFKAIIILKK